MLHIPQNLIHEISLEGYLAITVQFLAESDSATAAIVQDLRAKLAGDARCDNVPGLCSVLEIADAQVGQHTAGLPAEVTLVPVSSPKAPLAFEATYTQVGSRVNLDNVPITVSVIAFSENEYGADLEDLVKDPFYCRMDASEAPTASSNSTTTSKTVRWLCDIAGPVDRVYATAFSPSPMVFTEEQAIPVVGANWPTGGDPLDGETGLAIYYRAASFGYTVNGGDSLLSGDAINMEFQYGYPFQGNTPGNYRTLIEGDTTNYQAGRVVTLEYETRATLSGCPANLTTDELGHAVLPADCIVTGLAAATNQDTVLIIKATVADPASASGGALERTYCLTVGKCVAWTLPTDAACMHADAATPTFTQVIVVHVGGYRSAKA